MRAMLSQDSAMRAIRRLGLTVSVYRGLFRINLPGADRGQAVTTDNALEAMRIAEQWAETLTEAKLRLN